MSGQNEYSNAPGAAEEEEAVDKAFCLAELAAVLLGILGASILISGLGFYTVAPPGEADLCQVRTLGLENKTKSDQDFTLGTCHALYAGVFNSLHMISIPFILCGLLALLSAFLVIQGILAKSADTTPGHFKKGICTNMGGLVMVAVPAMVFPSVTAIVSAGLAPIHAYFITIMVAHFAVSATGAAGNTTAEDPAVRQAAETYETLYLGYCAASRTELCLFVGSTAMMVLVGAYVFDILRSLAFVACMKPNYNSKGCQLCKCGRQTKAGSDALYNKVGGAAA